MEISIIIPVYNVGQYLPQCLDSICCQWQKGIEIILVDDGSGDCSREICDRYGSRYPYISVIHQQNKGPSAARNTGIRMASGRYLLFIDADDYIAQGALAVFLEKMKADPADLYFVKAVKVYPDGRRVLLEHTKECVYDIKRKKGRICRLPRREVLCRLSGLDKYPGSGCTKLVSRQLIFDHGIYFVEGMRFEDLVWSLRCILCAETYDYIEADYYFYRQAREGAQTSTVSRQGALELYQVLILGVREAECELEPVRTYALAMVAYEAEVLLMYYGRLRYKERRGIKPKVENACRLLKYRRKCRTRCIRLMVGMLGVDWAAGVLAVLYEMREAGVLNLKAKGTVR